MRLRKKIDELIDDLTLLHRECMVPVIKEKPKYQVNFWYRVIKKNNDEVEGLCVWCQGEQFQLVDAFGETICCNKQFSKLIKILNETI